jgi:hypothetical protein
MCPIGHEVMREPVSCADGHSYERAHIVFCDTNLPVVKYRHVQYAFSVVWLFLARSAKSNKPSSYDMVKDPAPRAQYLTCKGGSIKAPLLTSLMTFITKSLPTLAARDKALIDTLGSISLISR